jgi:hypothetical protein
MIYKPKMLLSDIFNILLKRGEIDAECSLMWGKMMQMLESVMGIKKKKV